MTQASASLTRLPAIDRGSLPASFRAKEPFASFLFEDAGALFPPGLLDKDPFAARVVIIKQVARSPTLPRLQTETQFFDAPSQRLRNDTGWEDIPEEFFLNFVEWLGTICGVSIPCRGAGVQQGGALGRRKSEAACQESNRPQAEVHIFKAGIWTTLAPIQQMSAHAALGLHARPQIEYLDPARLTF